MSTSIQVHDNTIRTAYDLKIPLDAWKDAGKDYSFMYDKKIFKRNPFYQASLTYIREIHRFYHTLNHINEISHLINIISKDFSEEFIYDLYVINYFHDIVYNPKLKNNELLSAEVFKDIILKQWKINNFSEHPEHERVINIYNAILDTENHIPKSKISEVFCALDLFCLTHYPIHKLIEYEKQIFKEYQFYDYIDYHKGRLGILVDFNSKIKNNALSELIDYVKYRKIKVGIFPGSFRPFHLGHSDIIYQSENVFDKTIIARGINPAKTDLSFKTNLEEITPYKQIETFEGYLVDYVNLKKTKQIEYENSINEFYVKNSDSFYKNPHLVEFSIVRGLRNTSDMDFEDKQLIYNQYIADSKNIQMYNSTFFLSDPKIRHLSSSDIRLMETFQPGSAKNLYFL